MKILTYSRKTCIYIGLVEGFISIELDEFNHGDDSCLFKKIDNLIAITVENENYTTVVLDKNNNIICTFINNEIVKDDNFKKLENEVI